MWFTWWFKDEEHGNSNHAKLPAELSEDVVNEPCYRLLLNAAFSGDWEFAARFFEHDAASKTAKITSRLETVLHIAALSARDDQFVEYLVDFLSSEALEMVDCDGRTALHNAVLSGRIRMVKALVRRNPKLTQLADNKGRVPLALAALEASKHKKIAWFLAKETTDNEPSHPFSSPTAIDFILDLTYAGHLDMALYLVGKYDYLLTKRSTSKLYNKRSILDVLARKESHFPSGTRLNLLEELIYKCIPVDLNYKPTVKNSDQGFLCNLIVVLRSLIRSLWNYAKIVVPLIKRVHEVKLRHVAAVKLATHVCIAISSTMNTTDITDFFEETNLLYQATIRGISEIVKLCINFFPELIRISPHGERLTTHAVEFRQERTLRLFLKVSSTNELSLVPAPTLEESNSIMKAAATYKPKSEAVTKISGAAFQMQRELQWYKAVEMWVIPSVRTYQFNSSDQNKKIINNNSTTHWDNFVAQHAGLLEKGEKWTKDTANSCMLVSTLIATVLFAAAFTVPGGNDGNTGVPLLLGQNTFLVFAISDASGLFFSITAILLFLAILTSRYEPQDFLKSLPRKIIMGLLSLFISLASMLVTFAATLTIVLDKRLEGVSKPIAFLAFIPVVLFLVLQLPLLYQMVKSTYWPSIFRNEDIWNGVKHMNKIKD